MPLRLSLELIRGIRGGGGIMETDNRGWIGLHRSIQETEEWLSEPFTRSQAWIDLLLLANHRIAYIRRRGILVAIERGGIGYGEETLAVRWKWSRGKLRRYLAWLEKQNRIERRISDKTVPKNTSVSSYIYVTNYDKYQFDGTENGTEDRQKTVPEQRIKRIKKEEIKNMYGDFVLLTDSEYNKLVERFGELGTQDRIESLNDGIGSKDYKYKSHYHAILTWERNRKNKEPEVEKPLGGLAF